MMRVSLIRGALVGTSLSLGLAAGGVPAFAHKAFSSTGVIVFVGNGTIQIQTRNGSISTGISNGTHVIRIVNGSMADLTPGVSVALRMAPGTNFVTAVRVVPDRVTAKPDVRREPVVRTTKGAKVPEPKSTSTLRVTKARKTAPIELPHDGKIVMINGKTITLRAGLGHTANFSLAPSLTVTKIVLGSVNDLAVGETVNVLADNDDSAATEITILNA